MTIGGFTPVPACWVCGGAAFTPVHEAIFELSEYARQDPELAAYTGARVTLQRCRACGFAQPAALPSLPGFFDRMYDQRWADSWIVQEHDADYKDRIFADILRALDRRAAGGLSRAEPGGLSRAEPRGLSRAEPRGLSRAEPGLSRAEPRGRALLDVGAHAGRFLRLARDAGWDAEGLELNPKTAAYAAQVSGALVHQGNIHTFTPRRCYNAVTLTDVLEHVPRPLEVLTRVREFLCADGWLSIKVPNGPAQMVKETLRAKLRPSYRATLADNLVHVNHFSAASLARALTSAGFRDVTVGPAAPELPEGLARDRSGHWGRLAAYYVARVLPGGAATPLAFNLQAYGRRAPDRPSP